MEPPSLSGFPRSHLDAEGEVIRGSVQFAAVHHRVHVQIAQVGHVLQVPRFLLVGKYLFFQQVTLHQLRLQQDNRPLMSLWWSSRDQSGGGKNRPFSRTYGWVL